MEGIKTRNFKKTTTSLIYQFIRFVIVFGLCFLIIKPFIIKILAASMSPADLLDPTVKLLPKHFSNYYWKIAFDGLHISSAGVLTFLISLFSGLIQVSISSLVGYGLARFDFKLRKLLFVLVILIMLIPPQVYSVSQYLYFRFFGIGDIAVNLIDTGIPIFILSFFTLGIKQGLYIIMLRSFFTGLPKNLEEAAYIDGANIFETFFKIIIPNAKAVLTTIFLFSFCWQWTDGSQASLFFTKNILLVSRPGDIFIKNSLASLDVLGTAILRNAAAILIIIPLTVIFVLCQKQIVKGISTSGLAN